MGICPVTQAQWKAVMGTEPSQFKGANRPVESVTWHECNEFCTKLSGFHEGRVTVRLPSEAEWEYACRAGTTSRYSFGDAITPKDANYNESGYSKTSETGTYPPNNWGLYDMHGNVWEWVQDDWHANYQGAPEDGSVWGGKEVTRGRAVACSVAVPGISVGGTVGLPLASVTMRTAGTSI